MKKPGFTQIIIVILLLVNTATLIFLWIAHHHAPPPHPPHHAPGGPGKMIIKELGFDKAQEKKFIRLRDEHRNMMHDIHDSIHQYKKTLFKQVESGNTGEVKILAMKIAALQARLELHTYLHFVAVRSICTPQQKEKFNAVMEKALEMMAPPPPPHAPGPPPPPPAE